MYDGALAQMHFSLFCRTSVTVTLAADRQQGSSSYSSACSQILIACNEQVRQTIEMASCAVDSAAKWARHINRASQVGRAAVVVHTSQLMEWPTTPDYLRNPPLSGPRGPDHPGCASRAEPVRFRSHLRVTLRTTFDLCALVPRFWPSPRRGQGHDAWCQGLPQFWAGSATIRAL